jgi:hypothetical protein
MENKRIMSFDEEDTLGTRQRMYEEEVRLFNEALDIHKEEILLKIKFNNDVIELNQKQNELFQQELKIIEERKLK